MHASAFADAELTLQATRLDLTKLQQQLSTSSATDTESMAAPTMEPGTFPELGTIPGNLRSDAINLLQRKR